MSKLSVLYQNVVVTIGNKSHVTGCLAGSDAMLII